MEKNNSRRHGSVTKVRNHPVLVSRTTSKFVLRIRIRNSKISKTLSCYVEVVVVADPLSVLT